MSTLLTFNDNDITLEQFQTAVDGTFINDAVVTFTIGEKLVGGKVEDASDTSPIVITSPGYQGLADGDTALVIGVKGNTAANTVAPVTLLNPDTFRLDGTAGNGPFEDASRPVNRGDWYRAVPGAAEIPMPYLAGTNGVYRGVLPGTVSLEAGGQYVIVVRVSNYAVEFELHVVAARRRR